MPCAVNLTGGGDLPRAHARALQEGEESDGIGFFSLAYVHTLTQLTQVVAVVDRRVLRQSPKTEAFLL